MLIPEPSKNTVKRKNGLSAVTLFLQQNYQNTSTERLKVGVLTLRVVGSLQIVSFPLASLEMSFFAEGNEQSSAAPFTFLLTLQGSMLMLG